MNVAILVPAVLAAAAAADFADFDLETEGFHGQVFTTGGITFYDVNNVAGFYPDGEPFDAGEPGTELIVEQSDVVYNDFPDFVSFPNTLTFGVAFIPGGNVTIGPLATASMASGEVATSARLNIIYYENGPWGGIEVTLEALLGGVPVGSDSFTVADGGGRDNPAARTLSLGGFAFDELRLYATLNGNYTTVRALLDDVSIVPAPGSLALLGLGAMAARRRRA